MAFPSVSEERDTNAPSDARLSENALKPVWAEASFRVPSPESETITPRIGAPYKAPTEPGDLNSRLNLVGRLRPGFDGLPARPRKLRMMRDALSPRLAAGALELEAEYSDDGAGGRDRPFSDGGRAVDDAGSEEGTSSEDSAPDDVVSDGFDDVADDVGEDDSEYDPEEGSESESEYDPDEEDEARPAKKPRGTGSAAARGASLARTSSSQSLAGSEGSGGGVFPPRKKGRFTEEMDRVFLQRLGELFRQKVMLKDSFRYFPGR